MSSPVDIKVGKFQCAELHRVIRHVDVGEKFLKILNRNMP